MSKLIDLTGRVFDRLTVLNKTKSKNNRTYWLCKCSCGELTEVEGQHLKRGRTRSCGCYYKETLKTRSITHNMRKTRQYSIWANMISRCYNENVPAYTNYGGRGISVCEKWRFFEGFWEDMQKGYSDVLTIDRIDNNRGYYKENCKWSTMREQDENKRSNIRIKFNGKGQIAAKWAKELGINYGTLISRIARGWDSHKALSTPTKSAFNFSKRSG